jgi:hypothetical protein
VSHGDGVGHGAGESDQILLASGHCLWRGGCFDGSRVDVSGVLTDPGSM